MDREKKRICWVVPSMVEDVLQRCYPTEMKVARLKTALEGSDMGEKRSQMCTGSEDTNGRQSISV